MYINVGQYTDAVMVSLKVRQQFSVERRAMAQVASSDDGVGCVKNKTIRRLTQDECTTATGRYHGHGLWYHGRVGTRSRQLVC